MVMDWTTHEQNAPEDAGEANLSDEQWARYQIDQIGEAVGNAKTLQESTVQYELMTDGGSVPSEIEYMRVFEECEQAIGEEIAAEAADSEYGVDVYGFGSDQVAVAGSRRDVTRFVGEIRQRLGAETEFFNENLHETVPKPEEGSMERYETEAVDYEPNKAPDINAEGAETAEGYGGQ